MYTYEYSRKYCLFCLDNISLKGDNPSASAIDIGRIRTHMSIGEILFVFPGQRYISLKWN
jgi:hypothetical protein